MTSEKFAVPYTKEEDTFIRGHYGKGGLSVKEIAKELNRTPVSIEKYLRIHRILKQPHVPWTENDLETLRLGYKGRLSEVSLLGKKLNRTIASIEAKAASIGLKRIKRKLWSASDIEYLRENVGRYNVRLLAHTLHRSVNAVVLQIKTLRLHRSYRNGWYTTTEAASILGCSRQKIHWLIKDKKLTATGHYSEENNRCWEITREALKKFICKYPAELQGRNIDIVQIVDILTVNGVIYDLKTDGE
jgi:hypothetical protein